MPNATDNDWIEWAMLKDAIHSLNIVHLSHQKPVINTQLNIYVNSYYIDQIVMKQRGPL